MDRSIFFSQWGGFDMAEPIMKSSVFRGVIPDVPSVLSRSMKISHFLFLDVNKQRMFSESISMGVIYTFFCFRVRG
ncbi:MAG: hypothetical protein KDC31_10970 [Saprospiraceae bacterium]|nr:hypothetical protein [Saprospiraceae bacterium]MCO5283873.1 hypothetical protein [Saprospiraceae bacterium]MCO6469293.1 hypothetical protein [Saprospiraceae bacterium]HMY84921.1 hypothetical protein [Saprospiraceae bacterium]HNA76285.1 hypothetical protein [Saprospiraceae bacterium]